MIDEALKQKLIAFRRERDWEQFHTPKDVAISLSIEAAELLEWFQWRRDEEVTEMLTGKKREALEDEIADVAVYLTYLCHDLDVDLAAAVERKMHKNAAKYPKDRVKGRSDKYNEYS
ncbi:putative pyrophosphatase [Methylophaga frappieri]|uniref:Putative pyrophosphatase n=2 Tax=Methylophaga frappieri (strain ATCC BAA-2434 / DSM 25690 / JAM7) TaxID=754477 RepID=I1YG24_METFJ|nr:putative pyrophosphatase [Methylophaga frappieri]